MGAKIPNSMNISKEKVVITLKDREESQQNVVFSQSRFMTERPNLKAYSYAIGNMISCYHDY
jgi:hypothetical protein